MKLYKFKFQPLQYITNQFTITSTNQTNHPINPRLIKNPYTINRPINLINRPIILHHITNQLTINRPINLLLTKNQNTSNRFINQINRPMIQHLIKNQYTINQFINQINRPMILHQLTQNQHIQFTINQKGKLIQMANPKNMAKRNGYKLCDQIVWPNWWVDWIYPNEKFWSK